MSKTKIGKVKVQHIQTHTHTPVGNIFLFQILEAKNGEPNRFQSFWEKDEQDVDEFTAQEIQSECNLVDWKLEQAFLV